MGCMTRRLTSTVTVLFILSLVTRPLSTRFGMSRLSPYFAAAEERCFSARMVFERAISRRTSRMRPVPSCWPVARWNRRLNCSLRRSSSSVPISSGVLARTSPALFCAAFAISGVSYPGDEFGADRQLGRTQGQRLARQRIRHAIDLEHDAAGGDTADPELGRAFAGAHAHLGRLGRDRHVRENADPDAPGALHRARDGPPRRLDLARGDPFRLQRLQPVGAEVQREPRLGVAVDTALVRLAIDGSLGLQHCRYSFLPSCRRMPVST